MNSTEIAETLVSLARTAGEAILGYYTKGDEEIEVSHKADDSPLTLADMASHRIIEAGLTEAYPQWPVLSEESAQIDWEERKSWDRYWLVDPLDGTKEFIKKNGEFTVNIALIENHKSVFGVVYAPCIGDMYVAGKGIGTWKVEADGEKRPLAVTPDGTVSPLRVVGSRSHANPEMETFLSQLKPYEMLPMGSSLKLCMVAEGRADFYPRIGLTSEWDTAAAQCVVEEAGGYVVDRHGKPLAYNTKSSLLNDWFFVGTGSPDLMATLDIP